MKRLIPVLSLLLVAPALRSTAQLAVTEVHSNQSAGGTAALHADWWELSNYGGQSLDLTGWIFNDSTGGTTTGAVTIPALSVAPGESVVFVEGLDATAFRSWWGSAVGPGVQVLTYTATGIGLSSSGDGIRLWRPGADATAAPVLSVDFGASGTNTATFIPDPVTGLLTARSEAGVAGALAAADNGDPGSPGVRPPPIALSILSLTSNQTVNPGGTVILSVQAAGLPRPAYQWRRNGNPVTNATGSVLTLTNFTAASAGAYTVALDNGLGSLVGGPVQLRLAEAPAAPAFTQGLSNVTVFAGATVSLGVTATGVPQPAFAWYLGSQRIDGEASSTLTLASVTTNRGGTYVVVASNASGSVTNSATLTVLARPDIRFTEVSSARTVLDPGFIDRNGFAPEDWWELTSFSPVPVSLAGWRFDDSSASLAAALTITNANLVIHPGESMIFVERLTAEQFRVWWGTNQMPAGLRIVTYSGSGIGLSSAGDGLRLWNATATANSDTVAAVDFPAGDPGISFNYDPDTGVFGPLSVDGVNGVYQAPGTLAGVPELGSPGRIRAGTVVLPPSAPVLAVVRSGDALAIRFTAEAGHVYRLERRSDLGAGWVSAGNSFAPNVAGPAEFAVAIPAGPGQSLYRVTAE
jgi:Immunoglobulin I-set domain/Immunoglobulin domain